jgi:hypothetical protein
LIWDLQGEGLLNFEGLNDWILKGIMMEGIKNKDWNFND